MATIIQKTEGKRGCGYRRKGMYMICDGAGTSCGKLPFELCVCPMCGGGFKHTKGFTWINSSLFGTQECKKGANATRGTAFAVPNVCGACIMSQPDTPMGLMWVGKSFYPTPGHFMKEARDMGISKRIGAVPRNFKVGETWIALAHIEAIKKWEGEEHYYAPAIFQVFRPSRIEYVIGGDETEEELNALEERGFTLVQVTPDGGGDDEEEFEFEEDL